MDNLSLFDTNKDSEHSVDAFSAGIAPGGLRQQSEIKVLVAFLLDRLEKPLSKRQLFTVIQDEGLANYFEASQAVADLEKDGNITVEIKDDEEFMTLTQSGKLVVDIKSEVPASVREKALNSAVHLQTVERRLKENNIEIKQLDNGCNVTFALKDGEDTLMSLTLYVADMEQANAVRDKILEDPVKIYSQILSSLAV